MSTTFTYPGIYIQEVPSTAHTIVPAPTAVLAVAGRARRGPINLAVRIHSYADFVRAFGGIWSQSEMPFSVQQYFLNGGSDAYIVRAVTQAVVSAQTNMPAAIVIPTSLGPLNITAQNPGSWFQSVVVSIDWNTRKVNGVRKPDEFNITMTLTEIDPVTGAASTTVEKFANVSYLAGAANYIVTTLKNDSDFIAASAPPQAQPNPGNYSLAGMVWAPNYAFALNTILIDPNGNAQMVTTAGTSGRSVNWNTAVGGLTTDGTVTWTNIASVIPDAWQPLTQYTSGQLIYDGTSLQRLTTPASGTGVSGSQTPQWDSTTPDGPLIWTNAGPTGQWKAHTQFAAGAAFYDPANNLQAVTTAGITSAGPVAWAAAAGAPTPDGTAVWTNLGPKATITASAWTANTHYAVGTVLLDPHGNAQIVTAAGTSGAGAPDFKQVLGAATAEGPDTLVWTNIAASMTANWQAGATYQAGDLICDGTDLQRLTTPAAGTGLSGAAVPAWNSTTPDGALIWTNAGAAGAWQASTVYSVGASITVAGNLQVVTAATPPGKSGAGPAPPAFSATPGQTTTDNNLTWTNLGAAPTGGVWQANTFYASGAQIYDSNGNIEVAQNAGVSGGSVSWTWPTVAVPNPTTNDGTIVWKLTSLSGLSDGQPLTQADLTSPSLEPSKNGIYAFKDAESITLMVLPPYGPQENEGTIDLDLSYAGIWADALAFCQSERAVLLVDPPSPSQWIDEVHAYQDVSSATPAIDNIRDPNSVMYYPWLEISDPLLNNRTRDFSPSGTVAGVMARIDATRGVWKSPAGEEAKLTGVASLQYLLTDLQNGDLNPLGINCLRTFPIIGSVVWGARTLDGADAQASQWKYLAVRRMALFIEDSLYANLGWAVFEPNDNPLWSELRLNVGSFMRNLFRQGAFQGSTPQQAYFVKCDSDTTTQTDIDNGVVNVLVGFAPLKPAEFVVIKISQITGDASTS